MKRLIGTIFILLAVLFCFKNIISYSFSVTDPACMILDMEEENSEKEDTDEKKTDNEEEWQLGLDENLPALSLDFNNSFRYSNEPGYYTPYFEINSPPPERL